MLFPEDNISFEGPAERKAEGAEVVVVSILKESKAKAELLSSFSTSLAVVIHLGPAANKIESEVYLHNEIIRLRCTKIK